MADDTIDDAAEALLAERYDPRPASPTLIRTYAEEAIERAGDDPAPDGGLLAAVLEIARQRDVAASHLAAAAVRLADRRGDL